MKIWFLKCIGHGWNFDIKSDSNSWAINSVLFDKLGNVRFDGNWPKMCFRCIKPKNETRFPNVMGMINSIIIPESVLKHPLLNSYFSDECEAIPFTYAKQNFYLINIPNIPGSIIEKKHYTYKAVDIIWEYRFFTYFMDEEKIKDHHIFQDKLNSSGILVDDEFKTVYEGTGLGGIEFKEVWDSEIGNVFDEGKYRTMGEEKLNEFHKRLEKSTKKSDYIKASDERLKTIIVEEASKDALELIETADNPETIQMLYYYDGDTAQLEAIISNEEENESNYVWDNDSVVMQALEELLQRIYIQYPNDEDLRFNIGLACITHLLIKITEETNKKRPDLKILEIEEFD